MTEKKLIKGILPAKRYEAIVDLLKACAPVLSESLALGNKDVSEIKYFARKYYRAFPEHQIDSENLDHAGLQKVMLIDMAELTLPDLITRILMENRILAFYHEKFNSGAKEMADDYKNKAGIFEVKQTSEKKKELTEKFNTEMLVFVREMSAAAGNFVALTDLLKTKFQETFLKYK
jgi:hypothetical protein